MLQILCYNKGIMSEEHPMTKVGKAMSKVNRENGGGTLRDKLDPQFVDPEGAWKKGLPPAQYFLDTETQEKVPVPVKASHVSTGGSDVPPALEQHVLELYGEGVPMNEIERRFSLSRGYVKDAMVRRFGSEAAMKSALRALLLENGVATAQHTLANIEQLHPSQSGMLAATMTNAYIALDKHERGTPKQIDFGALAAFGETLARIEKYAGIAVVVDNDEQASDEGTPSSEAEDDG
jgi:hypothetical protein